ncbi:MAG: nicotinate-nucleotide adenylyltransferase [Proteobacteria bacterium]|nr:nicotinate-nucleotide adenylyltransferase [Pseudomonadota bacterium]
MPTPSNVGVGFASQPIAILGGTFDPVHNGHLRVAWEAAEALDAQVRLMPAHVPPHKPAPLASAAQRVAMLERALIGQSRLVVDTRELRREGTSYTVDTLRDLRVEFGEAQSLILLVGADAFGNLPTWREWRQLFRLAHIVMLTRPGRTEPWSGELIEEVAPRRAREPRELQTASAGKVWSIPVTPLDISATQVRALLAAGREPRWLMPEALVSDPAILEPYRDRA